MRWRRRCLGRESDGWVATDGGRDFRYFDAKEESTPICLCVHLAIQTLLVGFSLQHSLLPGNKVMVSTRVKGETLRSICLRIRSSSVAISTSAIVETITPNADYARLVTQFAYIERTIFTDKAIVLWVRESRFEDSLQYKTKAKAGARNRTRDRATEGNRKRKVIVSPWSESQKKALNLPSDQMTICSPPKGLLYCDLSSLGISSSASEERAGRKAQDAVLTRPCWRSWVKMANANNATNPQAP